MDTFTQRTRLAPSPTGALHLGNIRTFLITWALARQQGWRIVMRIEDLDGPRIKPGSAEETLALFEWLGIDWDEGPYYQRCELSPYEAALAKLGSQGDLYFCDCTRKQIEANSLSAPHGDEHEMRYPGTCRPASRKPLSEELIPIKESAIRVIVPEGKRAFHDIFAGKQSFDVQQTVGDFVVRTKDKLPSYQLAVVVDDARQGITQIVRGDDLLSSTPRQMILYDKLQLGAYPTYTHLPLVLGADGRRLAKRHGDTRLVKYRDHGVDAKRVVGLIAQWSGSQGLRPLSAPDFLNEFLLDKLPREPVVFTTQAEQWLSN